MEQLYISRKLAFLLKGIVVAVHDVSDGSAEVALDAFKHKPY